MDKVKRVGASCTKVVANPEEEQNPAYHVNAGVEGELGGVGDVDAPRSGDAVDALPVGDDEALEAQLPLEHVGEQELVGVHLHAVPAAVRGHDGGHPPGNRIRVRFHVDVHQLLVADLRVPFVLPPLRPAIAHIVLGARRHLTTATNLNKHQIKPQNPNTQTPVDSENFWLQECESLSTCFADTVPASPWGVCLASRR